MKLTLFSAILININIMLGAGLFINTTELAHRAGALGWLAYGIIGLLMLPLIVTIAHLVSIHPDGGFYAYGSKEFNQGTGFISAWTYFISKLASATLATHASATLICALIPALQTIPPIYLSIIILCVFGLLNTYNIRTGSRIQALFLCAKIIPIIFVIMMGFVLFSSQQMTAAPIMWEGLPSSIPLVMFAILGFEAACSLSSNIENPQKNAPRAIVLSFLIVIAVYCLYQFFAYSVLGLQIHEISTYQTFFAHLASCISTTLCVPYMSILYCAIAASTLGGAYGILYSNMWNIYTLAQHNHLIKSEWFLHRNKQHIPIWCVVAELIICFTYLLVGNGLPLPLQQIAATGCALTYCISVCALLKAKANRPIHFPWIIAVLAAINCLMLVALCITYLLRGAHPTLIVFGGLLIVGICMFWTQKKILKQSL